MTRSWPHFLCGILLYLSVAPIHAETYCVSTPEELQSALSASQGNGQDDLIKLIQGSYLGEFRYITGTEPFGLTIQGGYTVSCGSRATSSSETIIDGDLVGLPLALVNGASGDISLESISLTNGFSDCSGNLPSAVLLDTEGSVEIRNLTVEGNSGCAIVDVRKAANLEIDNTKFANNDSGPLIKAVINSQALVTLQNSQVTNNSGGYHINARSLVVRNVDFTNSGGWLTCFKDFGGTVTPDYVLIEDNRFSGYNGQLRVGCANREVTIRNNVFESHSNFVITADTVSNNSLFVRIAGNKFVDVSPYGAIWSKRVFKIEIINNSFVRNSRTEGACGAGAIFIEQLEGAAGTLIANNVFSDNFATSCPDDIYIRNDLDGNLLGVPTVLRANFFSDIATDVVSQAPMTVEDSNLEGSDPGFFAGTVQPSPVSILVDNGSLDLPAGLLAEFTVDGSPRIQGRKIDIGAHELELSAPTALPDINGNGSPELAILMHGGTQVHVRDGSSGEQVSVIDSGIYAALSLEALADLDLSGGSELALLTKQSDGQVVVQLRDSATGSLFKNIYYGRQYEPIAMRVIEDYSNNGIPEIAVMGSDSTDAIRLQIADAGTGNFLDNVFLGNQGIGRDFVAVPDISSNGMPELGVLSVLKGSEQIRTQIWDAVDATFQGNIWFGKVYEPFKLLAMPDINGNGADEIVVMGIDRVTQNLRVQVRDAGTSNTHYNIWLGSVNDAVDIASINDVNADGIADLAVLLSTPDGTGRVRVQSGSDGTFIRNLFYSVVENPVGLAVMPDYSGNGFDELAVLGENAGVRHVQILDTSSGSQVNRIDFP